MTDLRETLRAHLTAALKARDRVAAAALRSVIAELDNAEAVPVDAADGPQQTVSEHIAGGAAGLGAGEMQRRELPPDRQRALIADEIAARNVAADDYDVRGRSDAATRLRHEAEIIEAAIS